MAGVWREAGRREEEISWEAEGSSMISQYDLSMLYAVYMRLGRGQCIFHQWMNKCLPGSEGTLGAWAEVKDAWTEGFLDVLGYGGLKFRKTLTHVSHVPLTSLQKTFTWCFRETVTHLGPCSLVGFFTTERAWCFASEWLGSCTRVSLRVWASFLLSNWGNLRTRFWSWRQPFLVVLVLVLWFGEMPHAVDAVSSWCPLYIDYHWFISTTWQGVVN